MIEKGKIVKIHYSVKADGELIESTEGKEPISYVQGQKQLLGSVQEKLLGKKRGDKAQFQLTPDEAYGPYRPEAVEEIPRSEIPQWDQIKVGLYLQEPQPGGGMKIGRVEEVRDDSAILDFNHPMAGKHLEYAIEIMDVI